ncbi:hypothetical protein HU200_015944 [Digitaria exilis]|uniref:Uncharacterized protein n=1 Tax=Digitaria exilis TaxID=1010633 RepID=A0A835F8X0_9POAL|nr:hypothetical protein HU200_015944 [Digitaria exilis]
MVVSVFRPMCSAASASSAGHGDPLVVGIHDVDDGHEAQFVDMSGHIVGTGDSREPGRLSWTSTPVLLAL